MKHTATGNHEHLQTHVTENLDHRWQHSTIFTNLLGNNKDRLSDITEALSDSININIYFILPIFRHSFF